LSSFSVYSTPLTLKEQRILYDKAQRWLDKKQVEKYNKVKQKLAPYALSPYLDYRTMLIDLDNKSPNVVRKFINDHKEYPFSSKISAPYLKGLAKDKNWSAILNFQKKEPKGDEFKCYFYTALYQTGKIKEAFRGAKKLWLQGNNVSRACNLLFKDWGNDQKISDNLLIKRIFLSFENNQYALMSYLSSKAIRPKNRTFLNTVLQAYRSPALFLRKFNNSQKNADYRRLIVLSMKRLTYKNINSAYRILNEITPLFSVTQTRDRVFLQVLQQNVAERLLYNSPNPSLKHLNRWRDSIIANSNNNKLIEKRIRLAIKYGGWKDIGIWVNRLSSKELYSSRWQFWKAQSEIHLGDNVSGKERLKSLINERSFYSAAASTVLDKLPEFSINRHKGILVKLDRFKVSLNRIRELLFRDKFIAAKREWYWLLSRSNLGEKQALAYFARNSQWYHFSIVTSIKANMWDNLALRFPIVYKKDFDYFGKKYNVDPVTLISLARQESAMDRMAKSPVGARGLMQLMPGTAKYAAKKYRLSYTRQDELYNPEKNIEIGTKYLDELLEKYDGNRVLAFAAYNAGPRRVDNWLNESSGTLDVYRFIESIPYKETRGYVQNVLMFEIYYRRLFKIKGAFLRPVELITKY